MIAVVVRPHCRVVSSFNAQVTKGHPSNPADYAETVHEQISNPNRCSDIPATFPAVDDATGLFHPFDRLQPPNRRDVLRSYRFVDVRYSTYLSFSLRPLLAPRKGLRSLWPLRSNLFRLLAHDLPSDSYEDFTCVVTS